jgi:propanol-preferring alcohol dehydrogenase
MTEMPAWRSNREDHSVELSKVPMPRPEPHEVLVTVLACDVCRTDLHVIDGKLPVHRDHVIPGHQIVGEVASVGSAVRTLVPGDLVGVAWLRSSYGFCQWCRSGRENLCPDSTYTGWDLDGGYAEYLTVPAAFAYPLPAGTDPIKTAPLLCSGIIGYRALQRAMLTPGGNLGLYRFGSSAHLTAQIAGIHLSDIPAMNYERELFYERDLRTVTANTRAGGATFLRIAHNLTLAPDVTVYPFARVDSALDDLRAGSASGSLVISFS